MKKNFIYLTALIYLFTFLVAAPTVYAEKESKARIDFTPGTGPTQPVDPDKPLIPMPGEPVDGQLAIVSISNFDFKPGTVSSSIEFYDIIAGKPNIQIVDIRGSGTGWALSASASSFTGMEGQDTLPGATIHIRNGRMNSETPMAHAPTAEPDVTLMTDGTPRRIITAEKNRGQGLWIDRLYPENPGNGAYVQLEVPAGVASEGAHTSTIIWTLSDTP